MGFDIRSGTIDELKEESVDWLFVDVGFSSTHKSCGVLKNNERPKTVKFGRFVKCVVKETRIPGPPLNLLLEAPLSVAFDKDGNPTRRSTDEEGKEYRDWWYNAGASTLLATGYLLRLVKECGIRREVRLFEGFASFKSSRPAWCRIECFSKSDWPHIEDLLRLQCAAWDPKLNFVTCPDDLKTPNCATLVSAFAFAGMDFGTPPVVKACKCDSAHINHHLHWRVQGSLP